MRLRFISIVLCFSIFSSMFFGIQSAKAIPVVDGPNTASNIWNGVQEFFTNISTGLDISTKLAEMALAVGASNMINAAKVLALLTVQTSIKAMIGGGEGGGSLIIRDFKEYLYTAPQQRANAEMNSFFNTVSKGRLSSLNYEGVGPNYDAYLVAEARQAYGGQVFKTNLQEQATDPTRLFSTGNMRGIMTYMQCANNPACYTMTATAKYNAELARAQEIAKAETAGSGGFRPRKVNGRITSPAALAQSALSQIDQLGTQVIMNAAPNEAAADLGISAALMQIGQGMAISLASRGVNFWISDEEKRQAIRNKNDQFPFSLSYSANTGVGFSAGGVTVNTGAAAMASQVQIGNTCATTFGSVTPAGAQVSIDGKKYTCPKPGTETSVDKPSYEVTLPALTCSDTNQCVSACTSTPGCREKYGTLICNPSTKKCEPAF